MDLRFVQKSIFDLKVDGIIYFTDNTLLGSSSKYLIEKASNSIIEPLLKQNGCPTGSAKITPGFSLLSEYVILSVIPDQIDNETSNFLFKESIYEIFNIIKEYELNSIAVDYSYINDNYGKKYIELFNSVIQEKRSNYVDVVIYLCKQNKLDELSIVS